MKLGCVLVILVVAGVADADFSDNQFVQTPRILSKLIAAAEAFGDPFKSEIRDDEGHPYAYYLKAASYVGNCHARFGQVHVATFFFIRSGWKDGGPTPPAHGHSFIVFFDGSLGVRSYWRVDMPIETRRLRFEGSALLLDEEPVFDYAHPQGPPMQGLIDGQPHVIIDGKPQRIPVW